MKRTFKVFALGILAGLTLAAALPAIAAAGNAQPKQTTSPALSAPTSKSLSVYRLESQPSDKDAVALIKKLYAKDIADLKKDGQGEPEIYAQFVSLGKNKPKTSIAAMMMHVYSCGIKHCRTIIVEDIGNNKYRPVWDYVAGAFGFRAGANAAYYDLVLPTPTKLGNAETIWVMNDRTKTYEFRSGPRAGQ